ncbi:MAG: hypothetical protein MUC42_04530 [Bryobacter sp.]|nr:hypothetical protein [Bryobacter sp.]
MTRRTFLATPAVALAAPPPAADYHVHLDKVFTLDKALARSRELNTKFGIVEHAGKALYTYAVMLSDDALLTKYIEMLRPHPVYKGVQAEGWDWMECFTPGVVAKLDYVLTDALTMPKPGGGFIKIWTKDCVITDEQKWMDEYVAHHVRILNEQPIDILANVTFLPDAILPHYDRLWTKERMERIIEPAAKHRVALEINSRYQLPRRPFLEMAKKARARFSIGSNIHGLKAGDVAWSLETARSLGLTDRDVFSPARDGEKPCQKHWPKKG